MTNWKKIAERTPSRETASGNALIDLGHFADADRYIFDFDHCTHKAGWSQYDTDQDAPYFGVWVHPGDRLIVTYCEGDLTLASCATADAFKAELAHMAEFYGTPPPAFITIDDAGQVTHHFDTRPTG